MFWSEEATGGTVIRFRVTELVDLGGTRSSEGGTETWATSKSTIFGSLTGSPGKIHRYFTATVSGRFLFITYLSH